MGIYSRYILPRLIDVVMRKECDTAERKRLVPLARGRVLEKTFRLSLQGHRRKTRRTEMKRGLLYVVVGLVVAGTQSAVFAADLKPIHTQKTKDVVITLESESGQWKPGKNDFALTFTSAQDKKPVDAGKVSLSTSMAMSGMAPMIAGATLAPSGPGRYRGAIELPDRGTRQVTVTWDGPGGKGSTKFSVPVR